MFTYFASYEEEGRELKRLVRVEDKHAVFAEVKKMFALPETAQIELQAEDAHFQDCADLDWLPDRARIKVVRTQPSVTTQHDGGAEQQSSLDIAEPSTSAQADKTSLASADTVSIEDVSAEGEQSQEHERRSEATPARQRKIDVTQLSSRLRVDLERPGPLDPKLWPQLIQAVFDQKIIDVFYPSKRSYAEVAMGLIDQFGDKVKSCPSSLFESIESLKKRLRTKLKNERYRSDNEDLETEREAKRVKRASDGQSRRGLPFYLPTTTPPSVEVVGAMRTLCGTPSGTPSGSSASLKEKSFPERRRLIVSCRLPINRLMEKCPWLFSCDEVWEEFGRITGKETAWRDAERRWAAVLTKMKDVGDGTLTDEQAVEALLDLLGSDLCCLVGSDAAQPSLEKKEYSYAVMVEGEAVAEGKELVDAVLLWAVCHVVFAQTVRRGARRPAYMFVQRFILRVCDNVVVPKVCWAVAKRLGLDL